MTANETVAAVVDALDAVGIPYLLAGGYSANFYGVTRATKDADFVVQIKAGDIVELGKRLTPALKLDPQLRFEGVTGTYRYVLTHTEIPFKVEIFLLTDDPHDQARFARRVKMQTWSRQVWLPTVEDLLVMKLRWSHIARRQKDLEDIRNIVAVQKGQIDWKYVHQWCDKHGTRATLDELIRDLPST